MSTTNELLSVAIALISNFTNTVHVPPQSAPVEARDVVKFYVGLPGSPTDIFVTTAHGDWYGIHKGTVTRFTSVKSFFNHAEKAQWSDFTGEPTLNSNQVVDLATRTIQGLIKRGPSLTNVSPQMEQTVHYEGKEIGIYELTWPNPERPLGDKIAEVEIDARTGFVVQVHLWNRRFDDPAMEEKLRDNLLGSEFSIAPRRPIGIPFEHPTTNQVSVAIDGWLTFCHALGLDAGNQTNVADIDWEKTVLCTNRAFSASVPVYRVVFKNGTLFDSFGEAITCHADPDVCFSSGYMEKSPSELGDCFGVVTRDWEELANQVEHSIAGLVNVGGSQLPAYERRPQLASAKMGQRGLARNLILWEMPSSPPEAMADAPFVFCAELDLRTGKTKSISFNDPELVKMIGRSLRKLSSN
jgi:hypothetical protein